MDLGMVWGHGTQRGPEFSALSLHLVAGAVGDYLAQKEYGKPYGDLDALQKEITDIKIKNEIRPNHYAATADTLTLTVAQMEGLEKVKQHWEKTFKEGDQRYGILPGTIDDEQQRLEISRFFFWTAWVASTLRPGKTYTYTNNWPPDRQVGNVPTTETYFYSIAGVFSLLLVLGLFVFWIHRYGLWYGGGQGCGPV
jgi:nitric oxide reductase subunit B